MEPNDTFLNTYPDDVARAVRLLSVHPGPIVTADLAATLIGTTQTRARTLLAELARSRLLTALGEGHYTHQLGAHALAHTLPAADYRHAVHTLTQYFRLRLAAAATHLSPGRRSIDQEGVTLATAAQDASGSWFGAYGAAGWLQDHYDNLRAVVRMAANRSMHQVLWQIADHFGACVHAAPIDIPEVDKELFPAALNAAQVCGDLPALALMHQRVHTLTQDRRPALHHARRALEYYIAADDAHGTASATADIGAACALSGAPEDLRHAEHLLAGAEHQYRELNDQRGAGLTAHTCGEVQARRGRARQALTTLDRAYRTLSNLAVPDHYQLGLCQLAQAGVHQDSGDVKRAYTAARAASEHVGLAPSGMVGAVVDAMLFDLEQAME
jgi:tetratricopeptide (TPR) repeat protein